MGDFDDDDNVSEEHPYSDIDDDEFSDDEKEQTIEDLLNIDSEVNTLTNYDIYNDYLDRDKQTLPRLTKYERTLILGVRGQQLANGAKPLVEVDNKTCDVSYIANKELKEHKLPFIIKRAINDTVIEYWRLSDLEY